MLPESCKKLSPDEELKICFTENKVVAMINGSIESPSTEESERMVKILKQNGVKFAAIDLNQKPEILAVLK